MSEPQATAPRRILITGGTGQVGLELAAAAWPADVRLHRPGRDELDIADPASVAAVFARAAGAGAPYSAVINCAAYTAVDRAEADVVQAFAVNAVGPAALAQGAHAAGAAMVQVSTDYVFDGQGGAPYAEDAPTRPLNVYGASKLAGELAALSACPRTLVLRTAWVISPHGSNFIRTMLDLAQRRDTVRVVNDQHGAPTTARDVAAALRTLTLRMTEDRAAPTGVRHFAGAGRTHWAELAQTVFDISRAAGGPWARVEAVSSADYAAPARRPADSRLATGRIEAEYALTPRPWREAAAQVTAELLSREEIKP